MGNKLYWGRMKKIDRLYHSQCTKRQAEMMRKKNGSLIVNRCLKTLRSLLNGILVCTCNIFFKIHSNEMYECVCVCMFVCVHMRCMCALVYVTISVTFLNVQNILIDQATLPLYYISETRNVNVFNFNLFVFIEAKCKK